MFKKSALSLWCFILLFSACSKKPIAEVDNETQSALDFSNNTRDFISIIGAIHQNLIATPGTGANQSKTNSASCQILTKINGDTLWAQAGHLNPTYTVALANLLSCNNETYIPKNNNRDGVATISLTNPLKNTGAITIIKITGFAYRAIGDASSAFSYNLCDSITLKTVSSDANTAVFDVKLVNGNFIQDLTLSNSKLTLDINLTNNINNVIEPGFTFFGTATGTNLNGLAYTASIAKDFAISKTKSCYYFRTGNVDLTPNGFKARTLDYGHGNCDDDANFTVNGNTIAFKLK